MLAYVCLLTTVLVAVAVSAEAPGDFYSARFADISLNEGRDDSDSGDLLTEHSFETVIDHFNPQDGRIVNFTYTLNSAHYTAGGPLFLYVNDGGQYQNEWIEQGLVHDIAIEVGALLATADHRYFGKNIPTPTASFDDLRYLTVDQALGDLAVLIETIRRNQSISGPVIVFGTGYGATLAAHARKKFPHLVSGVFASSAYFRGEAIDSTYYDNLSMIIRRHGGQECGDRLSSAFDVLEYLIEHAESEYLQSRLNLCAPLDTENPQEVAILVFRLIDKIARYIHFHHLNGLQNFCRDLNAIPADPLNSLIRWINYAYVSEDQCIESRYERLLAGLTNTNWTEISDNQGRTRAIEYIYCTQLGGLKVSSPFVLDVFPADVLTAEYQYQFCRDILGERYNSDLLENAVELLNLSYGGQDQIITNVVFTNAELDPYLHHGVADYDAAHSAAYYLSYSAAGADLRSQSSSDSVDLADTKSAIRRHVVSWVRGVEVENNSV